MEQNNKQEDFLRIFNDDPFGLLDVKPPAPPSRNEDERLIASFQEIIDFYELNKREPEQKYNMQESILYLRLKGMREHPEKREVLEGHDKYGLLKVEVKTIESLEDIFKDDTLGLLSSEADNLFNLKHVSYVTERESADFVARRKPCNDFEKYEPLFKTCQADLKSGKRKIIRFNESHLREGVFFILNGILVYLEKIVEAKKDKNSKIDGRTRCVFENGTESEMLLRSLGKGLYDNGYVITENVNITEQIILENFNQITPEDEEAGFIYILQSKSTNPAIRAIKNLYKIGYSTMPVEERVKNAIQEPTYLMAAVHVVSIFKCYNMNPQKLEQLLHNFFGSSCLSLDVFDSNGKRHTPREWFIAPLHVIEKAIELVINRDIVLYKYDADKLEIVER